MLSGCGRVVAPVLSSLLRRAARCLHVSTRPAQLKRQGRLDDPLERRAQRCFSKSEDEASWRAMVDPKRVVSYDDVRKVVDNLEKVIIDVREPNELRETGQIPSSINIPLGNVDSVLSTMSEEDFQRKFQRRKPADDAELIFYCLSGRRSAEALDKALRLGYNNSKTYLGSWKDWSSKQN